MNYSTDKITFERHNRPALAAGLMVLVALFNAGDAIIVRLLANEVHPFVIVVRWPARC